MSHYFNHPSLRAILTASLIVATTQLAVASPEIKAKVADMALDNTTITAHLKGNLQRTSLTISGPRDFYASKYLEKGNPEIDLREFGELDDGFYRYQIFTATQETIKLRKNRLDNGRGKKERDTIYKTKSQSGHFRVKDGSIVIPAIENKEEVESNEQ